MSLHLLTHWTPMHAQDLPAWGARTLKPGPTVLVELPSGPPDA